jgi:hypothetical protein
MTDLDLIRELRPGVRLAGADELAPARDQLAVAIAAEISAEPMSGPARQHPTSAGGAVGGRHGRSLRRARSPRPARRLALAGVAATAVAAAVAVALFGAPGRGVQPARRPAAASSPARRAVIPPFTGQLTAARFLAAAARAALRTPGAAPRPGQFVYAETDGPDRASKYQAWLSADGSQAGLVLNGTRPEYLTPCTVAQAEAKQCFVQAGYLPGLPTRSGAILAYLTKLGLGAPTASPSSVVANWKVNVVGKTVDYLLESRYLLPAQRAALFEFMARTPGFTVAPKVVDAVGRPGVGIEWTYQGSTSDVIFDRQNYAYLGDAIALHGKTTWASALVKFAIVNSLPPRPQAGAGHPSRAHRKAKPGT